MTCSPANSFIDCMGTNAIYCDANGMQTSFACPAPGCMMGTGLTGCGQCTANTCTQGTGANPSTFETCDTAHDAITASGNCVTLKAGGNVSNCMGTTCQQCASNNVCGDGVSYGTVMGDSYTCTNGVLGAGTPCAYGCNATTGTCADLTPANQATNHLAGGDKFTCTGTQSGTLPDLMTTAGQAVAINTTAGTITIGGNALTGVQWGAPYNPTGSGTFVRVAHVKSVNLANGTKVTITGTSGLILLVDQGVTATGTAATPTFIHAEATGSGLGGTGPGANSTTAGGTPAAAAGTEAGGGGSGHGTAGGNGGGGNGNTLGGGVGGGTYSIAAMSEILEAGEAGRAGNGNVVSSSAGGNGGGALQISACGAISLGADVVIDASGGGGGGGAGGQGAAGGGAGGGGGGSGGTILLEAASFSVAGSLVSNGGGGGAGGAPGSPGMTGTPGSHGEDWANPCSAGTCTFNPTTPVDTAAKGGTVPVVVAPGNGGDGGTGTSAPANGANGNTGVGGGGGGGAVGVIFLNVPPGAAAPTVGASSPAIKTSHICNTAPAMCTYP